MVLRRKNLCAPIVTCLDTLWTNITSSTGIHQVTSTKGSLIPMLTKFHILKVKLLRFLLMHLLSVLFLRHSVSNCLLFSILELIKVLITMLQVLVQVLLSLACLWSYWCTCCNWCVFHIYDIFRQCSFYLC